MNGRSFTTTGKTSLIIFSFMWIVSFNVFHMAAGQLFYSFLDFPIDPKFNNSVNHAHNHPIVSNLRNAVFFSHRFS